MCFVRLVASPVVAVSIVAATLLAGCGGSDEKAISEQSCRELADTLIQLQRDAADHPRHPPDNRRQVKAIVQRADELGGCRSEPVIGQG
jgi:hypothetical protein